MGILGGIKCVFIGHKVARQCQKELLKSPALKYETRCERCDYPLELEIDGSDNRKYYVTEKVGLDMEFE
jgi:hypothetical protein